LADWWWTVDRWLLTAVVFLMVFGLLLCLAASPPVAERLNLDEFHFFRRQLFYLLLSFCVLIGVSFLTPKRLRRISLIMATVGFVLLGLTLVIGPEIKGATRWLDFGPVSIQPSEFLKPAFVVLAAWLFAEKAKRPEMPGGILSAMLYVGFASLLVLQPDYGQTALITAVWGVMLFLTGLSWIWILGLLGCGIAGMTLAYNVVPHVARRIDRFLDPEAGDTFQVDAALQSFERGGLFGEGPGEGTVKRILPDAHSDFIFAVAGEELGTLACLVLLGAFAFVVLRGLGRAISERDPFLRLATVGLLALFGFQAFINMAVNLALLPAKGMTLPFISYGGSSLLSVSFSIGIVLALTRRRAVRSGTSGPSIWSSQVAVAGR
jgi:cell division protein FtsW